MISYDITLPTPQENILLDDVFLELAERSSAGSPDPEVLRFWESPVYFVVLGKTSSLKEDVKIAEVRKDMVPVLRRSSGGGTVLQGKGCLNFTLILSKESTPALADLRKSYRIILEKVAGAFQDLGVAASFHPISDLAVGPEERKFSGNAQRRARRFILHHGSILYDFDISKIEKYLSVPLSMPEYRRQRSHKDFVTNVDVDVTRIKAAMATRFAAKNPQSCLRKGHEDLLADFLAKRPVEVLLHP